MVFIDPRGLFRTSSINSMQEIIRYESNETYESYEYE